MQLLDGRQIASELRAKVKRRVAELKVQPGLAIVLVGDDPASHLYVNLKERACQETGIRFIKKTFPADSPPEEIRRVITALNIDRSIHGIIVQLPLPAQLDEDDIVGTIDQAKDADGFHPKTIQAFIVGRDGTTPPVVRAIMLLIEQTKQPLADCRAVVLANSDVFATPLIHVLKARGAQATYVNPARPYQALTSLSDILIVALGKPRSVTAADVKLGAVVIDVGTTRVGDQTIGDVDAESIKGVASWLSPVPGGVGPVTVAALLENVVALAERAVKGLGLAN